ncbi:hypothetical protein Hanom_Chr11g01039681 [Helianthus anomalus]
MISSSCLNFLVSFPFGTNDTNNRYKTLTTDIRHSGIKIMTFSGHVFKLTTIHTVTTIMLRIQYLHSCLIKHRQQMNTGLTGVAVNKPPSADT